MGDNVIVPKNGMYVFCSDKECNYRFAALLNNDEKVICPKCKQETNLSNFAIMMLKQNQQYLGVIREDGLPPEETNGSGQVIEFDVNGMMSVVKVEDKKPFDQMANPPLESLVDSEDSEYDDEE